MNHSVHAKDLRHGKTFWTIGRDDNFHSIPMQVTILGRPFLSAKRQAVLPTKVRVYDLVNYASEMATHRIVDAAAATQALGHTLAIGHSK